MVHLSSEKLISLAKASRLLPRFDGKKHPHPSTLWRWCTRGLDGVKLDHVHVGRRICTSAEALDRFLNRHQRSHGSRAETASTSRSIEDRTTTRLRDVSDRLNQEGI